MLRNINGGMWLFLALAYVAFLVGIVNWMTSPDKPRFVVGDCVRYFRSEDKEPWERPFTGNLAEKILQVGKKKYRTSVFEIGDKVYFEDSLWISSQNSYVKVNCKTGEPTK